MTFPSNVSHQTIVIMENDKLDCWHTGAAEIGRCAESGDVVYQGISFADFHLCDACSELHVVATLRPNAARCVFQIISSSKEQRWHLQKVKRPNRRLVVHAHICKDATDCLYAVA